MGLPRELGFSVLLLCWMMLLLVGCVWRQPEFYECSLHGVISLGPGLSVVLHRCAMPLAMSVAMRHGPAHGPALPSAMILAMHLSIFLPKLPSGPGLGDAPQAKPLALFLALT